MLVYVLKKSSSKAWCEIGRELAPGSRMDGSDAGTSSISPWYNATFLLFTRLYADGGEFVTPAVPIVNQQAVLIRLLGASKLQFRELRRGQGDTPAQWQALPQYYVGLALRSQFENLPVQAHLSKTCGIGLRRPETRNTTTIELGPSAFNGSTYGN